MQLVLEVKNVSELTYRIFEIDTETYYKQHHSDISDSLDLDGLIPEHTYKVEYVQKKHHQHTETFEFPTLTSKQQGVFIVEFIGGGISSRAVIKKGSLDLLVQQHFQGFRLYVIDEEKKICTGKKTGMFIEDKLHKVNEKGFVLIPFSDQFMNTQAILTHEGFCSLSQLTLQNESYDLRTAVIFNEESVVSGRKLRLILKNKLYLNGSLITLKKLQEFNAEVQLTNYEGITNYKHFKDLKLSDADDHVLELIVPPMLTSLTVNINAKLKDLMNKDVNLANSEYITITRDEGTNRFMTVHLNRDDRGYFAEVRGKNGEAVPNQQVIVVFFKAFGNFQYSNELFTDTEGRARIGEVDEMKMISLMSANNNFNGRSFQLSATKKKIAISTSYNIVLGEDLVLPSMGLALNQTNFQLLKLSNMTNTPVEDCFARLEAEAGSELLVLKALPQGQYELTYCCEPIQKTSITVHAAKRWEANPLFLELPFEILQLSSESRYLSATSVVQEAGKLSFRVFSNSLPNVRVHILGYHHNSELIQVLENRSEAICPTFSQNSTLIKREFNSFRSNRVLSDEHVYVNERKNKQAFIGNTLEKPSILLHREKVRETKDDEEVLRKGGDFGVDNYTGARMYRDVDRIVERCMPYGYSRGMNLETSYAIRSNLDCFADSGKTLSNLHPDETGLVEVSAQELAGFSSLLVNVTDNTSNLLFDVSLANASRAKQTDLRVAAAKEQGLIYTEDFFALAASSSVPAIIADQTNTSNYQVEDLGSLLDVLLVIAGSGVNKTELQKWRFLATWHKLSLEEKFKKLEDFGGHELHVFTFFRDLPFFEQYIQPMLRHKAKKSIKSTRWKECCSSTS